MNKLTTITLILSALTLTGCVSEQTVNEQLSLCPKYFQENIAKPNILPWYSAIVPLTGGPVGWANAHDPNGAWTITSLASKGHVLHEAFHSFTIRSYYNKRKEFDAFVHAFTDGNGSPKPNTFVYLTSFIVPMITYLPVPGHVNFYSMSSGGEDSANAFAFWMQGKKRNDKKLTRKIKVIENYTTGKYLNKNTERK